MTAAYWVLATLLALFYLYAGAAKVARTRDRLRPVMAWVDTTPMPVVRALGVLEVLGPVLKATPSDSRARSNAGGTGRGTKYIQYEVPRPGTACVRSDHDSHRAGFEDRP